MVRGTFGSILKNCHLPFDRYCEVAFCLMILAGQMLGLFIDYIVHCVDFRVVWMGIAAKDKRREETWIQCRTIVE